MDRQTLRDWVHRYNKAGVQGLKWRRSPVPSRPYANRLCALVWESYEAIVEACNPASHFFANDPDRIRSIGTREWACVSL